MGALWANRTRSFLTALGIFIGVAAVVAMLCLTQGGNVYFNNLVGKSGNNIFVSPSRAAGGVSLSSGFQSTLTPQDLQAIIKLPHVAYVSPSISAAAQAVYGNQNWSTQINGVTEDLLTINNLNMAQGNWFSQQDETSSASVAVLGDTVYHNLFDNSGDDPIGKKIRIRDQVFIVSGVLQAQGFGNDDVIYVPLKTMQVRLNNSQNYDSIQVQVDLATNVDSAMSSIQTTLRQNHRLSKSVDNDFQMFNFAQVLARIQTFLTLYTVLFVGIAAISLTVGGIGIMNIMFVSVTERTWEIGIRMAVGARRRDIRNQFLMEAMVLCLLGGLIGLALGLVLGWFLTHLSQFPFVITPTTLIVPFAVSAGIALIFGIYPAIRASRLDPIVAIRTE
jgi:putative ABC transport system permease protein